MWARRRAVYRGSGGVHAAVEYLGREVGARACSRTGTYGMISGSFAVFVPARDLCQLSGEHLERRHWEAFAGECGLNGPRLIKRVEELANAVSREVKAAEAEVDAMPAGTHALMPAFVEAIEARARAIISGLSEDKPRRPTPSPTTLTPPAKRSRTKKAKA